MYKIDFKQQDLQDLFTLKDPFSFAEELEGIIYREHANRVTKEFIFKNESYFIKLHKGIGWKEIFKNLSIFKIPVVSAKSEWKALIKLKSIGIKCPEPVAFAIKGINPANQTSFLITKSLVKTCSLEELFLNKNEEKVETKKKKKILEEVARICRKMHINGINHRDLYLCHFHINKNLKKVRNNIYLIDLHRAQIRRYVPKRWAIKDIGGLYHSAIDMGLSETSCYRFLKLYFNLPFRELILKKRRFIEASRRRSFSMYMKPILKKIDPRRISENSADDDYLSVKEKNYRWIAKKEFLNDETSKVFQDPDSYMEKGEVIKKEAGHFIVLLRIDKNLSLIIKKYQIKSTWHFLRKFFLRSRANISWLAAHWLNLVGIHTVNHIGIIERFNALGLKDSYLITEQNLGVRVDKINFDKESATLIANRFVAFYKRLAWIDFSHGDAKSSNFILYNDRLLVFDLDISRKRFLNYIFKRKILKDIQRTLKSFNKNKTIKKLLVKRLS